MAITVTSPQATVGFIKNAVSADASGTEEILAGTAGAGNICVFCQGTILVSFHASWYEHTDKD